MQIAKYYLNDPQAPKPNSAVRLGTNVYLEFQGKLLLEQRWDCESWGLIGGRLRKGERYTQGIAREVYEETGIRLQEHDFEQIRICDDLGRIASYRDGTVWRMVIVLFRAELKQEPLLQTSKESGALRFFGREDLRSLPIVATHRDLIDAWCLRKI